MFPNVGLLLDLRAHKIIFSNDLDCPFAALEQCFPTTVPMVCREVMPLKHQKFCLAFCLFFG